MAQTFSIMEELCSWMFAGRSLRRASILVLALATGRPGLAAAQTIDITGGVQKYASLSGTTANLSGKCELWVTNSATPLSGCLINLNSFDGWLFLPGVKPSAVVASYLGQVRVNGAAAVADNNLRVVQYGQDGAVVIPESSTFQPLAVFTQLEDGWRSP